jgi:hypothetical protein
MYGDGFFDMPAGFNDADMEMASLESAGARHAKRYRGFTEADVKALDRGDIVTVTRWFGPKDDRQSYEAQVRALDTDEIGPCDFRFSVDGSSWHESAKDARLAQTPA